MRHPKRLNPAFSLATGSSLIIMAAVCAIAGPAAPATALAEPARVSAGSMRMAPVLPPGPRPKTVSAKACAFAKLREGALGTTQVDYLIDGQTGVAQVPATVAGAAYNRPAAADVYVYDPNTLDFFQGGWYVGGFAGSSASNGLPATAGPRAWFGESIDANHEILSSPVAVTPGQHAFSVRLGPGGRAYGFVDGVQRWISTRPHVLPRVPGVTGESNNTCTSMNSRWFSQASSLPKTATLQLHRSGGSYSYWVQHVSVNGSGGLFRDGRFGGVGATDCATPTGAC